MKTMNPKEEAWARGAFHLFTELILWFGLTGGEDVTDSEEKEFQRRLDGFNEHMESADDKEDIRPYWKLVIAKTLADARDSWAGIQGTLDGIEDVVGLFKALMEE
jgi:hypothetical protein